MKTVESFLNYCSDIKEYSNNTIKGYKNDLDMFFDYMRKHKPVNMIEERYIQSITLDDLYGFINYLKSERNNQAISRARKIATLKSYYSYLEKRRLIKENPTIALDTPKLTHKEPIALSEEESLELLMMTDIKGRNATRNKSMLITFINTGLRLNELRELKVNQFQENTIKILGKGKKERVVPICEAVRKSVEDYLKVRKFNSEYLFVSERGNQISESQIGKEMRKFLDQLNKDGKITTHILRKTYATLQYRNGTPIATISKNLGHSNLNTTMIYLGITEKDLEQTIENNPLANIY